MKKIVAFLTMILLAISVCALAGPVPDTGQTKCYDNSGEIPCPEEGQPFYGQDAQYAGPARSYTKLGQNGVELPDTASEVDGWIMTRDNVTGLVWEIKQNKDDVKNYTNHHDADNTYTWYDSNPDTNGGNAGTAGDGTDTEDFINALNSENFGGFSDWRLPTIKELSSLVNSSISSPGPTIDTAWFPHTLRFIYWSSTGAGGTDSAWRVYFYRGGVDYFYKSSSYHVRAVRAGQSGSSGNLMDNGDETVTDTETGLMWQKATTPVTYTWQQALAYAEGLTLGGHSDWRLPNLNELQTLVDYTRYDPAIDPLLEPNTFSSYYQSSTTYASYPDHAWLVHFNDGIVGSVSYVKTLSNRYYVRAVRAGQVVSFVKTLPLINATAYDPAPDLFLLEGSSMGGSTGYITPESGLIHHNAEIAACALSSWGWARVGIDVVDGILSDSFTVTQSGTYKLVLSGKLNGSVIEGSTHPIPYVPGVGKTTGELYIAGQLIGENAVDYSIKTLHDAPDDILDWSLLNDIVINSCENIISYFVPGGGALTELYDVLLTLDKKETWNNETFQIISYNYLEANKDYKWSIYVRSVLGSTQAIGGAGAALYEMEVSNLTADLYTTGDSIIHTVTSTAGPNGVIMPSGNSSVMDGQEITFRATPNQGYLVDRWYVDEQDVGGYSSGLLIEHVYNDRSAHVTFRPMPDLEITDLHPEPSSATNSFAVGQEVDWSVTIKNNGGNAEVNSMICYLGETPDDLSNHISDDPVIALDTGAEVTITNDYTFTEGDIGERYLICIADYQGDVNESNEENNYEIYGPFNVVDISPDADTDDDGIPDVVEDANQNGVVDPGETDPCNADTDGDGIQDGTELGYTLSDIGPDTDTDVFQPDLDSSTTTNPLNSDTDGDGLSDGQEDTNHNGMFDPGELDPNHVQGDVDGDGDVDLEDSILSLQVMAGITPSTTIYKEADVNGDGNIGIEEVIYILQKISGLRQ
jgi:hypothetical protein